jgi:hypothetical protein
MGWKNSPGQTLHALFLTVNALDRPRVSVTLSAKQGPEKWAQVALRYLLWLLPDDRCLLFYPDFSTTFLLPGRSMESLPFRVWHYSWCFIRGKG